MSDDFIDLLKLSGCGTLFFGVENGSPRNLALVGKKTDLSLAERLFRTCHRKGIKVNVGWIIGFPGETQESFMQTVSFAKKIRPYVAKFDPANPLMLHPGCDMWADPGKYGVKHIHHAQWEIWEDGVNSQQARKEWLDFFNKEIGDYFAKTKNEQV